MSLNPIPKEDCEKVYEALFVEDDRIQCMIQDYLAGLVSRDIVMNHIDDASESKYIMLKELEKEHDKCPGCAYC